MHDGCMSIRQTRAEANGGYCQSLVMATPISESFAHQVCFRHCGEKTKDLIEPFADVASSSAQITDCLGHSTLRGNRSSAIIDGTKI